MRTALLAVCTFAAGVLVGMLLPDDGEPAPVAPTDLHPESEAVEEPSTIAAPPSLAPAPQHAPPADAPPMGEVTDVGILRQRLGDAAKARDWGSLHAALEALGHADTPEADRLLVDVLGNESIRFEGPMGARYRAWLENSTIDGVAEAARRRVAIDAAAFGVDEEITLRDWVRLLMAHGTETDLAWVREVGGAKLTHMGYDAMMEAGHAAALELARSMVDARYDPSRSPYRFHTRSAFQLLAEQDPAWVRVRLAEEFDRLGTGRSIAIPTYQALPLYAKTLSASDLDAGRERILGVYRFGLKRDANCIRAAIQATRNLEEAGHDITPLAEIVAWPAEHVLDAAARGPPPAESHHWNMALHLLQIPRPTWTDREIAALEAALPLTQGHERLRLLKAIEQARRASGSTRRPP